MNVKKLALSISVGTIFGALSISSSASEFPPERGDMQPQAVTTAVTAFIIDQAKSAILSEAESWLMNQLFGSSAEPSVVNLHQDSLDAIRDILAAELEEHRYIQLQQDFNSYVDYIQHAHDIAQNGGYDAGLINNLVQDGTSLTNHSTYTELGHSHYFTLTGSRAAAYSMLLSVYTERVLHDDAYTRANVRNQTTTWAANLTAMGAAADSYITSNLVATDMPHTCHGTIIHGANETEADMNANSQECIAYVFDNISGQQYAFAAAIYGYEGALLGVAEHYNYLVEYYRDLFKGEDFNEVIERLENF